MVKCLNCGKDVEEGVSVCPNCGTSIRTVEIGAGKKTKGSKKKFIFLAVGLVILFAVILAVIMLIGGKKKRPVMEDGSHAYIDVDGNAYCYNGNGKLIIVEGEWVGGSITGDGKHIVLIDMEKNIYCFNGKGKKGVKIVDSAGMLITIHNNGLFYTKAANQDQDSWENVYRYTFDTRKTIDIGPSLICPARHSLEALVLKDQEIYILPESADELVAVASCEGGNEVNLIGISDNGKMAVWTETKEQTTTIYTAENKEKEKLGRLELKGSTNGYTYALFFNQGSEVIVGNGDSDQIFRKKVGEVCIKAEAGGTFNQLDIYTIQGMLYGSQRNNVKGIYVVTKGENYLKDLYYIDENGNSERLIWNIKTLIDIQNGKAVMLDTENSLYKTDLMLNTTGEFEKISTDVDSAQVSKNGNYIYYGKDLEDGTFTLYECKVGINLKSTKIADDVFKMKISADGNQVIYLKNPAALENSDMLSGDLYVKDVGKDPVKVSSDVISLFDKNDYITNDDWYCFQFDDIKEKRIVGKILHYDGKDADVEVEDIWYNNLIFE